MQIYGSLNFNNDLYRENFLKFEYIPIILCMIFEIEVWEVTFCSWYMIYCLSSILNKDLIHISLFYIHFTTNKLF